MVTLNQMVLSHTSKHGGSALAIKLIDIYFTLFRLVLDRKIGVAAERDSAAEASGSDKGAGKPAPSKHGKGAKKQGKGSYKGKKGTAAHKGTKRIKTDGVATAEEVDSRMLGALLTGVRRAYPYVGQGKLDDVIERHSAQLFRTVHLAPFSVATQALMLLYQVNLELHPCILSVGDGLPCFAFLHFCMHLVSLAQGSNACTSLQS